MVNQIIMFMADSATARPSFIRARASVVRVRAGSTTRGRRVAGSTPGASMTLHRVPLGSPSAASQAVLFTTSHVTHDSKWQSEEGDSDLSLHAECAMA